MHKSLYQIVATFLLLNPRESADARVSRGIGARYRDASTSRWRARSEKCAPNEATAIPWALSSSRDTRTLNKDTSETRQGHRQCRCRAPYSNACIATYESFAGASSPGNALGNAKEKKRKKKKEKKTTEPRPSSRPASYTLGNDIRTRARAKGGETVTRVRYVGCLHAHTHYRHTHVLNTHAHACPLPPPTP